MTLRFPTRRRPVLSPAVPPMVLLALVCAVLLSACIASASRPASLMEAYAAVDAARSDRKVRAFAPAGLREAETALARAFRAWQAGEPAREVNQLANVALQRASTARSQASEWRGRNGVEILEAQAQRPGTEPPQAGAGVAEEVAMLVRDGDPLLPAAGEPLARMRSSP